MSSSKGKINLINHKVRQALEKKPDPIPCPNCGAGLRRGVKTPCRNCGTRFRRCRRSRSGHVYEYERPWIATMSRGSIEKFREDADVVYRTADDSFVYAKEGETVRLHIEPLGILKRCMQILLRPFDT